MEVDTKIKRFASDYIQIIFFVKFIIILFQIENRYSTYSSFINYILLLLLTLHLSKKYDLTIKVKNNELNESKIKLITVIIYEILVFLYQLIWDNSKSSLYYLVIKSLLDKCILYYF